MIISDAAALCGGRIATEEAIRMSYAIITEPVLTVYDSPRSEKETESGMCSTISDEELFGNVCRVLSEDGGWSRVITRYGYEGCVRTAGIKALSDDEAKKYFAAPLKSVTAMKLDVMNIPTIKGVAEVTLPRGAAVTEVGDSTVQGWTHIGLWDGRDGYVPTKYLTARLCRDRYLFKTPDKILCDLSMVAPNRQSCRGGDPEFSFAELIERHFCGSEEGFRTALTEAAKGYLGVQYRWGGRSPDGVDCSGLVHSAYLACGAEIFRDASIADGWPMERIDAAFENGAFRPESLSDGTVRPGDALYFPGHVAMYLGSGKYIHSTAKAGSNGVVINSLLPGDADFRADLVESLYAVGGLRLK